MQRYSSLFISHGAPTLPHDDHPARAFLSELGHLIVRPRAVVVVSPHWLTRERAVKSPPRFKTWHDFSGFPEELYALEYDAPGDARVRDRVRDLLGAAGLAAVPTDDLRLDHGVWVPLMLMYPKADIPVVQVSATSDTPRDYFAVGRALAPLAGEGVLMIGSGGAVHNLGALDWSGGGRPASWATAFDDWLHERVAAGDWDTLYGYRQQAPDPARAHPTEDHFLPLFFAGGAGGAATSLHRSFSYGNLSMAAYGFA